MPVSPPRKDAAPAVVARDFASPAYTPPSETELCAQPEKAVTVLAISPHDDDHVFLRHLFNHSKWNVHGVRSWADALDHLSRRRAAVVLCESQLPDTTWKQVLDEIATLPDAPLLIVTSRLADENLWAEVLNLGGYDVLMKPFDRTEVIRVVSLAWLNWKSNYERARKYAAPKLATAAG